MNIRAKRFWFIAIMLCSYVMIACALLESRFISRWTVEGFLDLYSGHVITAFDKVLEENLGHLLSVGVAGLYIKDLSPQHLEGINIFQCDADQCILNEYNRTYLRAPTNDISYHPLFKEGGRWLMPVIINMDSIGSIGVLVNVDSAIDCAVSSNRRGSFAFALVAEGQDELLFASENYNQWLDKKYHRILHSELKIKGIKVHTVFSNVTNMSIMLTNFVVTFFFLLLLTVAVVFMARVLHNMLVTDIEDAVYLLDSIMRRSWNSKGGWIGVMGSLEEKINEVNKYINNLRLEIGEIEKRACFLDEANNMAIQSSNSSYESRVELKASHQALLLQNTSLQDQYIFCIKQIEHLERLNKQKSEFLANISHEILTPLNAVLGFTGILRNHEDLSPTRRREYIAQAYDSGCYLVALTRAVMDFVKAEHGVIVLNETEVRLDVIIQECIAMVLHDSADTQVMLNLSPDILLLKMDAVRIKQVLNNVLSNAVKFSYQGGSVEIYSRLLDTHFEIEVKDSGIGIAQEDMSKVLELFGQGNTDRSDRGLGMGLALSKKIIEAHGGMLRIHSHLEQGTSVIMELPISRICKYECLNIKIN